MESVKLNNVYRLKSTNFNYKVFDITGASKGSPNPDGKVIYLQLTSKLGWFEKAQAIITITERTFWNFFSADSSRG